MVLFKNKYIYIYFETYFDFDFLCKKKTLALAWENDAEGNSKCLYSMFHPVHVGPLRLLTVKGVINRLFFLLNLSAHDKTSLCHKQVRWYMFQTISVTHVPQDCAEYLTIWNFQDFCGFFIYMKLNVCYISTWPYSVYMLWQGSNKKKDANWERLLCFVLFLIKHHIMVY